MHTTVLLPQLERVEIRRIVGMAGNGEIIIYRDPDGHIQLDVKLDNDEVWLSQEQIADLFEKPVASIAENVKTILADEELDEQSVVRKFRATNTDGAEQTTTYYNIDIIFMIGFRVSASKTAIEFRKWATKTLKEFVVKGFVISDRAYRTDYFQELLDKVREIRTSEQHLYRQVTDLFATSQDYDPSSEDAAQFFSTIQNKFHYAVHRQTAAELIMNRVDAGKPNMGMLSWKGGRIKSGDITIAKNYLTENELRTLGLIASQFLDFAELRALRRIPMTMADWRHKVDEVLRLNEMDILDHAGTISSEDMREHAKIQFEAYKNRLQYGGDVMDTDKNA